MKRCLLEQTESKARKNTYLERKSGRDMKEGEGMEQIGNCRFCGQAAMIKEKEPLEKPQLDEIATMRCVCEKAEKYQEEVTKQKRAYRRIEELCGADAGEGQESEEVIELLKRAAEGVCGKAIKAITVKTAGNAEIKIAETAKGKIKIGRKKTMQKSFEE